MGTHVRGGMLLAVLSLIPVGLAAKPASAQFFSRNCRNCQQAVTRCNCQTQQPVVETQMVPQQVTTYRNEAVTQYRQEAVTQNVPVTTYRDVIVDEGSYQTVYVPKQVTKRIPQVSYQQQIAYRSVPYQVTRQVPQVTTQMVARQSVRYQPYSYQTTLVAPVSVATAAPIQVAPVTQTTVPVYGGCAVASPPVAGCGLCAGVAFAPPACPCVPMMGQPVLGGSVIAAPIVANPVTMLPPTAASAATSAASYSPETDLHSNPVPDPKFLDSPGASRDTWTTVGSKSGKASDSGDLKTAGQSGVRFKPARTVYRSWETQSRIAAGDGPERR